MKKTILLGEKGMISSKISKWLLGILGLLWFAFGTLKIYADGVSIGSIGYIIIGLILIVYSVLIFTANPFAPKVSISENEIKIKRKVFSRSVNILWTNIESIEFDQYLIVFNLKDGIEEFDYSTNAEISIEIKSSIREAAENKHIEVKGG